MSKKFQLYFLNNQITKLQQQIQEAKSHIDLVHGIGIPNSINYYPLPHHQPIQHPVYGKISPTYHKYVLYTRDLPAWESQLQNYYQQERELCAQ